VNYGLNIVRLNKIIFFCLQGLGGKMKKIEELVEIKYFLKIKDSVTNKECDVYVPTESDLDLLLLLLKSATDLQYDVKELQ
jgi:hypothetical protein